MASMTSIAILRRVERNPNSETRKCRRVLWFRVSGFFGHSDFGIRIFESIGLLQQALTSLASNPAGLVYAQEDLAHRPAGQVLERFGQFIERKDPIH